MVEYYRQRAAGGAGLIIAEGILIFQQGYVFYVSSGHSDTNYTFESRTEWKNAPGIWSKDQIGGWKKVTDAVHAEGSVIYAQVCARFFL